MNKLEELGYVMDGNSIVRLDGISMCFQDMSYIVTNGIEIPVDISTEGLTVSQYWAKPVKEATMAIVSKFQEFSTYAAENNLVMSPEFMAIRADYHQWYGSYEQDGTKVPKEGLSKYAEGEVLYRRIEEQLTKWEATTMNTQEMPKLNSVEECIEACNLACSYAKKMGTKVTEEVRNNTLSQILTINGFDAETAMGTTHFQQGNNLPAVKKLDWKILLSNSVATSAVVTAIAADKVWDGTKYVSRETYHIAKDVVIPTAREIGSEIASRSKSKWAQYKANKANRTGK